MAGMEMFWPLPLRLKKLRYVENNSLIKRGYGSKALSPSAMDRQNVKLALQIFNRLVSYGWCWLGTKNNIPNFESVAKLIDYIGTWWEIMNVKTSSEGIRKK